MAETSTEKAVKWIKTAGIAALGGGLAGTVAGMMDSTKYHIPQDLFSGKLWPHFFMGAATTFGALLLKSPLGQKVMTAYENSQQQAKEDAALLDKVKGDLKAGAVGPAAPPPTGPTPSSNLGDSKTKTGV